MASLQKNVASQNFTFCLVLASSGVAFVATSSTNITGNITKDGGAQTTVTGTIALLGNGQYNYAPTQGETNATDVGFLFTATGAIPINIDFHTDLTDAGGNLQVDVTKINAIGTSAVTTVNANQGTTQPLNFTGTGASALVQGDVKDWNSVAVGALPTNFSVLSIDASGNVSTTSNIKKNTASSGFMFVMINSTTGTPMTGLTVTAQRALDGGAFGSCTNSPTEISNGWYTINLSAGDTNGNHLAFRFSAAGANDTDIELVTQP